MGWVAVIHYRDCFDYSSICVVLFTNNHNKISIGDQVQFSDRHVIYRPNSWWLNELINLSIACPSSKLPSKPFFRMLVHSLYRHYFPPEMLKKRKAQKNINQDLQMLPSKTELLDYWCIYCNGNWHYFPPKKSLEEY